MVVLETTFLVDLLRNKDSAVNLLEELEHAEPHILITTPSIMELWEGALRCNLSEKEKRKVEELITVAQILVLDVRGAKRAAEITTKLRQKGSGIETRDSMIAGITIANGEMLVTRDSDYAKVPGLRVLKY